MVAKLCLIGFPESVLIHILMLIVGNNPCYSVDMFAHRLLDIAKPLEKKSFFLFGPRGTGKSTWVRNTLPAGEFPVVNLLESETRLTLLQNPSDLRRLIAPWGKAKAIVIDEIQKIPELLDEVHDLIETNGQRFLLTGSSARKLKRDGGNLLAGRARVANLFPFVFPEIKNFDRDKYLHLGGLPAIWTSDSPWEDLRSYVDTYLKEEIEQEAQVRQLGQFARFLHGAATHNGDLLNYSSVSSDAQVPESTVRGYYQILVDTLVGSLVEPYRESKKRKAIQTAKFYFFDTGVTHAIQRLKTLERNTPQYGRALEQWIFMELRAYLSYRRIDEQILFWRSVNGQEVDFVIGDLLALEVKSKKRISSSDLTGLHALAEEVSFKKNIIVSNEPYHHFIGSVECMPFEVFLEMLWSGAVI